ncbi:cobyrinic acid a,c-diamide synthase [Granulicella rosea]|uniref:Cobyrinate a,c-diamide synthase n=1 Tax=Granulicella rosea TaxID=474952 RepID=A0A239ILY9_9BACT|nr:cobyrinate a,c-diamide synthase [Granulicella rosea]SNS94680.1 cobyrinic acid a,c-diamide synthase [Granulicella rosea]
MIAGSASGVGKTTVTLAILAAARRRGWAAQPFKGGPDFLDTGHHSRIAGRTARNLDTWMLSHEANRDVLRQSAVGADLLVAEGMMGLFDGKSGDSDKGSSAEIAKLLRLPVVLVLDAGKSARSIAAVVLGFESFDPELPLAGVILNRVASENHLRLLRTAIEQRCKTPILGWLPREPAIAIPERHLGLQTAEEAGETETQRAALADLAEKHLDLDRIFKLECGLELTPSPSVPARKGQVRIGVARDRAFSFYYEDNLDLLRQHGAAIVPFSPLADAALPPDLDALYLGGGYPELHAAQLSANSAMLASIRSFAAEDGPIYAECGGMIYLSRAISTLDGANYPMTGVLPFAMEMTPKLVRFGYTTVELTRDCLLGKAGDELRGHSFHYSRIAPQSAEPVEMSTSYRVAYSLSGKQEFEGFTLRNVLASYIHLHFRTAPGVAEHLVHSIQASRQVPA